MTEQTQPPEAYQFGNKFGRFSIFTLVMAFIIFVGINSCYYTVQPDEEAVIIRLGLYEGTFPPGLHFKLPFGIDEKILIKTKKIHHLEFGFRTKYQKSRRKFQLDSKKDTLSAEALMVTGDLNVAIVQWVVLYQIADPYKYLFKSANPKRNIKDVSESIMRRVVGDMFVSEVLTTGRSQIESQAKFLMQEVLDHYDIGITIRSIKLQDVDPPEKVRPSFNEVNMAKQEQEKMINQAEREYNRVIPEARGKAMQMVAKAEGYATAVTDRAKGNSKRFLSIAKEYRKAPALTKKKIYLEMIEKVFSSVDSYTVVDPEIKGVLPLYSGAISK